MKKYGGLRIAIRYFKEADVATVSMGNFKVQWIGTQEMEEVFGK